MNIVTITDCFPELTNNLTFKKCIFFSNRRIEGFSLRKTKAKWENICGTNHMFIVYKTLYGHNTIVLCDDFVVRVGGSLYIYWLLAGL